MIIHKFHYLWLKECRIWFGQDFELRPEWHSSTCMTKIESTSQSHVSRERDSRECGHCQPKETQCPILKPLLGHWDPTRCNPGYSVCDHRSWSEVFRNLEARTFNPLSFPFFKLIFILCWFILVWFYTGIISVCHRSRGRQKRIQNISRVRGVCSTCYRLHHVYSPNNPFVDKKRVSEKSANLPKVTG